MWDDPRAWVLLTGIDGDLVAISDADGTGAPGAVHDVLLRAFDRTYRSPSPIRSTLPLFVDTSRLDGDADRLVDRLLAEVGLPVDRVEVVELAHPRAASARAFALPLQILAVGPIGSRVVSALTDRGNPWLREDAWGGRARVAVLSPADLDDESSSSEHDATITGADVLITDADVWELLQARPVDARFSVVVHPFASHPPATGAATVLHVHGTMDACVRFVDDCLGLLGRDLALHDAVRWARDDADRRGGPDDPVSARLTATPDSVQALRLTPMLIDAHRRIAELSGTFGSLRQAVDLPPSFPAHVESWVDRAHQVAVSLPSLDDVSLDVLHESLGLDQIVDLRSRLDAADSFVRSAADAPEGESALAWLERTVRPARVVNVGVRAVAGPQLTPSARAYLDATTVLAARTSYDVDVQVGPAWPHSIVVGDRPPIDPQLPDSREGNEVTVCLFTDALDVPTTTTTLHVPPTGASSMVTLRIVTREAGPLWFRLGLYHRNNLVQTILVTGLVGERVQQEVTESVLVAQVDHVTTERWSNLADLGPRDVSFTVNASSGSHRLFVKADDLDATVSLDNEALGRATTDIRAGLAALIQRPLEAADLVVGLARSGWHLYTAIVNQLRPEDRAGLRAVMGSADRAIQVIRADIQQALPWSLVYDWPIPDRTEGVADPPGCLGQVDGRPCGHSALSGTVCVNGFWAVRHLVEELLADAAPHDDPTEIPVSTLGALVASGLDPAETTHLTGSVGMAVQPGRLDALGTNDALLPRMFAADHPGLMVFVGQYSGAEVLAQGEPVAQRIRLSVVERWLTANQITTAALSGGDWKRPGPFVVLMSCTAVATQPTDLNSLLGALKGAGAGAVIGSEVDLRADLAGQFTERLLAAMRPAGGTPGSSYATAMRDTRLSYIHGGDLRALVFDAFGPAELRLS